MTSCASCDACNINLCTFPMGLLHMFLFPDLDACLTASNYHLTSNSNCKCVAINDKCCWALVKLWQCCFNLKAWTLKLMTSTSYLVQALFTGCTIQIATKPELLLPLTTGTLELFPVSLMLPNMGFWVNFCCAWAFVNLDHLMMHVWFDLAWHMSWDFSALQSSGSWHFRSVTDHPASLSAYLSACSNPVSLSCSVHAYDVSMWSLVLASCAVVQNLLTIADPEVVSAATGISSRSQLIPLSSNIVYRECLVAVNA